MKLTRFLLVTLYMSAMLVLVACGAGNVINEMKINRSPDIQETETTSECDFNEHRIGRALAYINLVRSEERLCGSESYPAAPAVKWNAKLYSAANTHSEDMSIYDKIGHQVAPDTSLNSRIDDSGYEWETFAENVAGGLNTPEQAVDAWMASPGHCKNIMNASFSDIGLACAINAASSYRSYWTLLLAAPSQNQSSN